MNLIKIFQYKGIARDRLLTLVLKKYHLLEENILLSNLSQIKLFEQLIYFYAIYNNEIDLKKLSEFYFLNKDYYFPNKQEQTYISIVLRWETEVGNKLIEKIKQLRNINGKQITWEYNDEEYNLSKWNSLFDSHRYMSFISMFNFKNPNLSEYTENYLNLDFISLNKLAANQFYELENLSLNNIKICKSYFVWPKISNVIMKTLCLKESAVLGIDFQNIKFINKISLKQSNLVQGSLILPDDPQNNVKVSFKKPSLLGLIKDIFSKKELLFQDLTLTSGHTLDSKELYEFYNWYTYYVVNIRGYNKFSSLLELIFTRYFSSYMYIFLSSIFVIIIFAFTMYLSNKNNTIFFLSDKIHNNDFFAYLYFSLANFTTLGFGEIVPLQKISYFIVSTEVFIGYVMLGLFLAIVSKRHLKY